jgi:hypothetical protein
MSIYTEGTVPGRISDADLRWAGLNDWQVTYLSQATPEQRDLVYREAIRLVMEGSDTPSGFDL